MTQHMWEIKDGRQRKRAEKELLTSRQQLRSLTKHLLQAREEERAKISREIHDELGQVLATIQMGVSLLAEEYRDHHRLTARISVFEQMLEGAIKTVQRISSELRPLMLDILGLCEALEWQAGEFQKRTGIACKTSILIQKTEFSQDLQTTLYRIFQEALTNIIRHSGATRVDVTLEKKQSRVVLIIMDNGRGISREQLRPASQSLGITGMKERAYALGGRVKVCGTPLQGTTVIARIPIEPPTEG